MAKFKWTPVAPETWEMSIDGVNTGITLHAPAASADALSQLDKALRFAMQAEVYLPHFRAYNIATNARAQLPKEALPPEVLDGLAEAEAFDRVLKGQKP